MHFGYIVSVIVSEEEANKFYWLLEMFPRNKI